MRQVTSVKPLIANFITPKQEEEVSLEVGRMFYDPQGQITIFECGSSGPTQSGRWKHTKEKTNGGYYGYEDERPHTDD